MCVFTRITGLVSENPFAVTVLSSPKNFLNLQKNNLILLFLHSEPNWVRKSYFQPDLIFQDCFITRWLETTCILVIIEKIYRYQFKSSYLKNQKSFAPFLFFFNIFGIYIKFSLFWKKKELFRSSISNVIKSERCAYLNA